MNVSAKQENTPWVIFENSLRLTQNCQSLWVGALWKNLTKILGIGLQGFIQTFDYYMTEKNTNDPALICNSTVVEIKN